MSEPLRILLIDDDSERACFVTESLSKAGFVPLRARALSHRLLNDIVQANPDVILVDMESPGRDILESLTLISTHNPTPIVMYAREQDPETIKQAVASGVSTYLVGDIDTERVGPVIEVALAQFGSYQQLRKELEETRSELEDRRLIDRAKQVLCDEFQLSEQEAYQRIRNQAMQERVRTSEIARRLLDRQAQRQDPKPRREP
ncbi:MAG: ANTAR domain-containing protein [Pseudomonadota bacterium]